MQNKLAVPEAGLPSVLVARDRQRGQRVVACCRRSELLGIKQGMASGEAASLLKAYQDASASVQTHDAQADLDCLQELAEGCAERFSPIVAIDPLGPRR